MEDRERVVSKGANPPRRNALGRGLSALMESTLKSMDVTQQPSDGQVVPAPIVEEKPSKEASAKALSKVASKSAKVVAKSESLVADGLVSLPMELIFANENQPRKRFSDVEIDALASSIQDSGVLQPILVRRRRGKDGEYEIIAGERRWRAATRAGLSVIPAILKPLTDREAFEVGVIENAQRSDLDPVEEAEAYQRLIKEFGATQGDVARMVGRDRVSIANSLRLLKLPESIRSMIAEKKLSAGHGRALLMLASAKSQERLAAKILAEDLSVRAIEQLAKKGDGAKKKEKSSSSNKKKRPSVVELEDRIRRALGTKVTLDFDKKGVGELKIQFFSKSELDSLLEKINA